ncbi:phage tail protein [Actinoplanes sp. NPDC049265]|uniref:phage tail protein n=1 Tax=Actinoplanes sp. NPDC049265 TaxID=3363902 RepID=UPI00371B0A2F
MLSGNDRTPDPPWTGRFVLTVDGLQIGTFTEVGGLSVTIEVEEVAEGGQNQHTHKLPGRMKWPNLVFKRGLTDSGTLFDWFSACSGEGFGRGNNRLPVRNGEVSIRDGRGRAVQTWRFADAYPVRWTGPRLAATSRDLAVEELEVCHSGFTMAAGR